MTTLLLVLALALPNLTLTPGKVRPLTTETVCATKWGLDARHVTARMRLHVFVAYGIPAAERRRYVIDHLIARELAGADDVLNLWPQPISESRQKDRLWENGLHRQVCAGTLTLAAAQATARRYGR